jgi:hypothetical protein
MLVAMLNGQSAGARMGARPPPEGRGRLYVFKKARAASVKIRQASFQEIVNSLWKMTSVSGGYDYPNLTKFGDKEAQPGGLLGDFRTFCEQNAAAHNLEQLATRQFNLRFT